MAIPDTSEDVITMAAESVLDLVEKNDLLHKRSIEFMWVRKACWMDPSLWVLICLDSFRLLYRKGFEETVMSHCDVVDMVFACIGAVDALQNCLDYVRLRPNRKAIVISNGLSKI